MKFGKYIDIRSREITDEEELHRRAKSLGTHVVEGLYRNSFGESWVEINSHRSALEAEKAHVRIKRKINSKSA